MRETLAALRSGDMGLANGLEVVREQGQGILAASRMEGLFTGQGWQQGCQEHRKSDQGERWARGSLAGVATD